MEVSLSFWKNIHSHFLINLHLRLHAMYIPNNFKESDLQELLELIQLNSLAAIVWQSIDGITADHIPLFYEDNKLVGHVAKANPICKELAAQNVLVIFQGANSYISPNWYPTKQEDHKAVPTWNYAVVHVHGKINLITENSDKLRILKKLTSIHEASQETPWSIDDAPADYIEKMMNGVIGIEIEISKIEGKWKVSQNQPAKNKAGIVGNLQKLPDENSAKMATFIKKRDSSL